MENAAYCVTVVQQVIGLIVEYAVSGRISAVIGGRGLGPLRTMQRRMAWSTCVHNAVSQISRRNPRKRQMAINKP
ncbi:hypothetical protein Patl1_13689 [Pistacia atlantica]|uniref:Uncharacterized protein n=1 Tax=Pistacia atlantica TaxID=434234 RepID=A0ACC1AUK5_9ROSI|nr:hypothetical protein Patl1_13689 [Pistacia atlantica]